MSHTPGATRAARIILNGKHKVETLYGVKTKEGIADLIDRETAAPALLAACEALLEAYAPSADRSAMSGGESCLHSSVRNARAAIAVAKGG